MTPTAERLSEAEPQIERIVRLRGVEHPRVRLRRVGNATSTPWSVSSRDRSLLDEIDFEQGVGELTGAKVHVLSDDAVPLERTALVLREARSPARLD